MGTCRQRSLRAAEVEEAVWEFVSGLLKDPEWVRAGMEALIERERAAASRLPAQEAAAWVKKLEECNRLRRAYQDQQAAGLMTLEELASRLKGLEETRRVATAELRALEAHEERVSELERDRDALLGSWVSMAPEALDQLTGEERNKVYRMLRLEVIPTGEGFAVSGAICTIEPTATRRCSA
jgi:flagellar motility protein MotE (MotC chaperone)